MNDKTVMIMNLDKKKAVDLVLTLKDMGISAFTVDTAELMDVIEKVKVKEV